MHQSIKKSLSVWQKGYQRIFFCEILPWKDWAHQGVLAYTWRWGGWGGCWFGTSGWLGILDWLGNLADWLETLADWLKKLAYDWLERTPVSCDRPVSLRSRHWNRFRFLLINVNRKQFHKGTLSKSWKTLHYFVITIFR